MLEYILKRYIGDDFECVKQKSLMIADEYGRMVQASNEALKLLRPFAKILGQTE